MQVTLEAAYHLFGVIEREGDLFIAHCPPLDVATQGETRDEAKKNLLEACELFILSCLERGTLDAALRELGWVPTKQGRGRLPAKAFPMTVQVPFRFRENAASPA